MPKEKEKIKTRPKKDGDGGPIGDDAQNPSGDASKIDAADKSAKEAKDAVEKARRRLREKMAAKVEKDDVEIKNRDKQRPGE